MAGSQKEICERHESSVLARARERLSAVMFGGKNEIPNRHRPSVDQDTVLSAMPTGRMLKPSQRIPFTFFHSSHLVPHD